jgi:hypothetical protein
LKGGVKMTLRDITEQGIEIQGNIIVKQINEQHDNANTILESDSAIFNDKVLDMEIQYMYCENNKLVIEVE